MRHHVLPLEQLCHHVIYDAKIQYATLPPCLRIYQRRYKNAIDLCRKFRSELVICGEPYNCIEMKGGAWALYKRTYNNCELLSISKKNEDLKLQFNITMCDGKIEWVYLGGYGNKETCYIRMYETFNVHIDTNGQPIRIAGREKTETTKKMLHKLLFSP